MIIGISGYAGSGKDTVARMLQCIIAGYSRKEIIQLLTTGKDSNLLSFRYRTPWQIVKFTDPLRQIAAILLNVDVAYTYTDEFKQKQLPATWNYQKLVMEANNGQSDQYARVPMTGRIFMQKLGTEAIRDGLHPNAWITATMNKYSRENSKWLITDLRFQNEFKAIKLMNGITVRVKRTDENHRRTRPVHVSETDLDGTMFDYYVNNKGESLDQLYEEVHYLAQQLKLI